MKTYLNREGKYVSEEPVDGHSLGKDKHGKDVYHGDRFTYYFRGKYCTVVADKYNTYWISKGVLKRNKNENRL